MTKKFSLSVVTVLAVIGGIVLVALRQPLDAITVFLCLILGELANLNEKVKDLLELKETSK